MIADNELIDKIKNFRKSHNLSVKDFARICNIGERVMYRVESGVSVHKSTIKIIIRALSLSDDDCHRLIKYYDDNERYLSYKRNNMQKEYRQEYRRNNRDRINAYARTYAHNKRVNNPAEARERDRIIREKNRDKLRVYNREYQRKRRARLKANADSRATSEAPENSALVTPVPRKADD